MVPVDCSRSTTVKESAATVVCGPWLLMLSVHAAAPLLEPHAKGGSSSAVMMRKQHFAI